MISGWVLLDKPSGMTSRAAGARVARMYGAKTFGHLGTLDPMASGLLPIALGEATKTIGIRDQRPGIKEYEFSVVWGIETDTGDITGNIVKNNSKSPPPDPGSLEKACESLVGGYDQMPPAFSAKKINGVPAYKLARRGKEPGLKAKRISIYELKFSRQERQPAAVGPMPFAFRVKCSTGTYVRSLARDIAAKCGTIAACDMIRRVASNGFGIEHAVKLDFLENLFNNTSRAEAMARTGRGGIYKYLHLLDFGLDDIPVLQIQNEKLFRTGGFIPMIGEGIRRVYYNNKFIGIGVLENNLLKPKRIINVD